MRPEGKFFRILRVISSYRALRNASSYYFATCTGRFRLALNWLWHDRPRVYFALHQHGTRTLILPVWVFHPAFKFYVTHRALVISIELRATRSS